MRIVSSGGGVQSTALQVLAAEGRIDFDTFVFANVGEDSERPKTLAYVNEWLKPHAEAHGLTFHEVRRVTRDGRTPTLYEHAMRQDTRSIDLPVRMQGGGHGNRWCSINYKRNVVLRWMRENGATPANPGTCAIGFSYDEIERMERGREAKYERKVYPLIDMKVTRAGCRSIITQAGLPMPPKSSCYFCPFQSAQSFAELKRDAPDLFAKAVVLEDAQNETRVRIGKDAVFFTQTERPLSELTEAQAEMFPANDDAPCGEGCMT